MKKSITKKISSLGLSAAIAAGLLFTGIVPHTQNIHYNDPFVTVVSAKSTITLTQKKLTLTVGETAKLKVKGTKVNVKWSSKNAKVASVTKKGVVKAKKEGNTVIIAKVSKKTLKSKVTVNPKPVTPLSVNWNNSSANAKSIRKYVQTVTDSSNKDSYIPVSDRIAVFDMDGTLLCETYPTYFNVAMFVDYCLYDHPDKVDADVKEIAEFCKGKTISEILAVYSTNDIIGYFAKAYKGLTVKELYDYTVEFGKKDTDYFTNMSYGDALYLPMIELVKYLYDNDFTIYVCTGTERTATRAIIENSPLKDYIEKDHIIGTEFEIKIKGHEDIADDSTYQYEFGDDLIFTGEFVNENVKASKVILIQQEIGKQPVLAFGNSSGDNSMCKYVLDNNKYPSAAYLIVADDATRDYGNESTWEEKNETYAGSGINLVSMRNDWRTIYGDSVARTK